MQYSATYIGAIVSFLAFLAKVLDVELPYTNEEIEKAIIVIAGIVGFLITLYGRFRKGDLKWTGKRVSATTRRVIAAGEKVRL
jgi:hypothetical protein